MIRTTVIIAWTLLATVVIGILAVAAALFSRTGNLPHRLARLWARSILLVAGVPVEVGGADNIDPKRSCIFMVNHQSNFDIPVLLARLPAQFRWLAKSELFKIPLFGRAMRGCGYISIDRYDRDSAFRSLEKAAMTIRNGTSVLIFPEGTRSRDGRIQPFKKGGFVMAVNAAVPIVPIVLHGTWCIMPRNRWKIRPRSVRMDILPPVETSGYRRENKDELIEKLHGIIRRHFERLELERETVCN
jgi:1-acyl-sn-glycerol-3-phosphate acyltransferase